MNKPMDEADQFLMGGGGGAPSAFTKDTPLNTWVGGKVLDRCKTQQTDIKGKPLWWDKEQTRPREQLEVTVQTDERVDGDDTGRRRFFVKGDLYFKARDAVAATGAPGVQVGGEFHARRIGKDAPKERGLDGAWLHEVRYVPKPAEEDAFLTGGNGNGAAAAQAAQQTAPTPSSNGGNLAFDATQFGYLDDAKLAIVQGLVMGEQMSVDAARAAFPPPAGWSPQVAGGDPMAQFEPRLNRVTIKEKVPSITDAQLAAFEAANLDTATVLNMFGASA